MNAYSIRSISIRPSGTTEWFPLKGVQSAEYDGIGRVTVKANKFFLDAFSAFQCPSCRNRKECKDGSVIFYGGCPQTPLLDVKCVL